MKIRLGISLYESFFATLEVSYEILKNRRKLKIFMKIYEVVFHFKRYNFEPIHEQGYLLFV